MAQIRLLRVGPFFLTHRSRFSKVAAKKGHRGWALEAQSAVGHPHEADLEDARIWTERMIIKAHTR